MEIYGMVNILHLVLAVCLEKSVQHVVQIHPFPYLNKQHTLYATLCGRDTVQYDNDKISQEMVREFLKQHHLNYRENKYMIMFEYKGHRIVSFEGGRMLIHGTTKTLDAIHLINQLFG